MKICLVAMSGIRVVDEKLVELGLTLPGFVERSKVIASLPSLGLLTLAGIETKQSVDYTYIEIEDINKTNLEGYSFDQYDAVAVSSFSAQINEAYDLGKFLKSKNVISIIGGLHVTAVPEEAAIYFDAVVVGEGELFWQEIINDIEKKTMKKIYQDRNLEFDFTESPIPAYELLDIEKYNRLTVQTSRGCTHRCNFCGSSVLLTRKYKQKPKNRILAEIDKICQIWEKPFIEFADDNTFIDKKFWKKVLPEIKERNIRWFTETDISIAEDDQLLRLVRDSGCVQVLIGLESPQAKSLSNIELNSDWKSRKFDNYKKSIDKIQSHGVSVNGCFVLGLDNQSSDIFDDILKFTKELKLHQVQITILTPFPGTELYKELHANNRLIEPTNWKKTTLFDINYYPSNMTIDELSDGFKELLGKIYSKEMTDWRNHTFKEYLRKYSVEQKDVRKGSNY